VTEIDFRIAYFETVNNELGYAFVIGGTSLFKLINVFWTTYQVGELCTWFQTFNPVVNTGIIFRVTDEIVEFDLGWVNAQRSFYCFICFVKNSEVNFDVLISFGIVCREIVLSWINVLWDRHFGSKRAVVVCIHVTQRWVDAEFDCAVGSETRAGNLYGVTRICLIDAQFKVKIHLLVLITWFFRVLITRLFWVFITWFFRVLFTRLLRILFTWFLWILTACILDYLEVTHKRFTIRSVNSDFTFIGAQVNRGGINGIESKNYKRRSASFVSDCVAVKRLDSFWAGNGCFNFIAFIQTYDFVDNTVFRVFVIAIMNKICKRNFLGCNLQGWLVYGRLVTVLALIVTRLFGPLVTRLLRALITRLLRALITGLLGTLIVRLLGTLVTKLLRALVTTLLTVTRLSVPLLTCLLRALITRLLRALIPGLLGTLIVRLLGTLVTKFLRALVTRLLTVFSVVDAKSGRYPSVLRAIGSNGIFAIFDIVRNLDFNFDVAVIVSLSLLGVHCTIIGMYRDIYVTFWREAST